MCLAASWQVSCPPRAPRLPLACAALPAPLPAAGEAPSSPHHAAERGLRQHRSLRSRGSAVVTRQAVRGATLRDMSHPLPGPARQPPAAGAVSPLGSSGIGAGLLLPGARVGPGGLTAKSRWDAAAAEPFPPRWGRRAQPPRNSSGHPPGTAEAEPVSSSLQRGHPRSFANIPTGYDGLPRAPIHIWRGL